MARLFVSVDELSRLLPVSTRTIRRMIDDGDIPAEKARGRLVIPVSWVRGWARIERRKSS